MYIFDFFIEMANDREFLRKKNKVQVWTPMISKRLFFFVETKKYKSSIDHFVLQC